MKQREERPVEILPNEPLDMSMFHPDIRASLGNGVPLLTVRTPEGATAMIFGGALPATEEENERRWAVARDVAGRIAYRAGKRAYEQMILNNQRKQGGNAHEPPPVPDSVGEPNHDRGQSTAIFQK